MRKYVVLLFGFIAVTFGASPQDSNNFLDTVLRDHLPGEVRNSRLDPAPVPKFEVKVKATFVSNKNFKAKFQSGNIYGLSSAIRRRGDCSTPGWQGANVTLGCHLSLDGVRVSYQVTAKGHKLFGSSAFNIDFYVQNTNVFLEVSSWPPRPPTLKTLTLSGVELKLSQHKDLGLNQNRRKKYEDRVKENVKSALTGVIHGAFKDALSRSLLRTPFPRP